MGGSGANGRKRARPRTKAGRKRAETWRLKKLLAFEAAFWDEGVEHVAGVDEAGRGPLAGPVLAAAVILPPHTAIRGVDDSKRLTTEKREALFDEIRDTATAIAIGAASTREVDQSEERRVGKEGRPWGGRARSAASGRGRGGRAY